MLDPILPMVGESSQPPQPPLPPPEMFSTAQADPRQQLTVLYYNARSLLPKLDELRVCALSQKPDIICIVETWLSEDVTNNEILLPDYQVHRLDRNRHGGGVLVYAHNSLSTKVLLQGGPYNLEFLALLLKSGAIGNSFCICLFYRPPSSPVSIFDNLCTTLQVVNPVQFSTFLLLGDFNVNFCNPSHFLFSYVKDIMHSFSLSQVVPSCTHVNPNGSTSLIDLALLSDLSHLQSCVTLPPLSSSDHLGVSLALKWKTREKSHLTKPRRIWMYKNANFPKARELIQATNWEAVLSDDVDISTELWIKKFLEIMEECIPRQNLPKKKNLPWLTKNIVKHMRKRNDIFRKAKKSKLTSHFTKYRRLRNEVTSMLRLAKQKYFSSLMFADTKKFWKTVKVVKKQKDSIPALHEGAIHATTDADKANMLNNYFSRCWNYSEPQLSEPSDYPESSYHQDLLCTTDELVQLIQNLDVSKANGPDGVSARMLKATANSIAP